MDIRKSLIILTFVMSAAAGAAEQDAKHNFNQLSASQIVEFATGIDEKAATAIVQYREKVGPFTGVENILVIPGISFDTIEANRDRFVFTNN